MFLNAKQLFINNDIEHNANTITELQFQVNLCNFKTHEGTRSERKVQGLKETREKEL